MKVEDTRSLNIVPLRDDVVERCSPLRYKWLNLCDNHYGALLKSLRRQMRERPEVWGVGLWGDAQREQVASTCADLLRQSFGLPNNRLIPEDGLCWVVSFDEFFLDDVNCRPFSEIEEAYRLVIKREWYSPTRTFGDLVAYVCRFQGMAIPGELKTRG